MSWDDLPAWSRVLLAPAAVSAGITGFIALGFRHRLDKLIQSHRATLDRQLKKHESKLAVAAARIEADLRKQIADDAIYVTKRHDAIAGFYAVIHEAQRIPLQLDEDADHQYSRDERMRAIAQKEHDAAIRVMDAHALAVLYLPDKVDAAAREVVQAFWQVADALNEDSDGPSYAHWGASSRNRNTKIVLLRDVARTELQGARPTGERAAV